jgi:hypothetical protein
MFTIRLTEFSVLIIFIQFLGIDLFTMLISAVQLKMPELYREVAKCWNLSGGGQTKSPVTFIDIRKQIILGKQAHYF